MIVGLRRDVGSDQARIVGDREVAHAGRHPQPARIAHSFRDVGEKRRGDRLGKAGAHGEFADAGAFDHVDHWIVGAHLRGELALDVLGVAAPIGHLDEGVFFLKGRGQRAQRLIDDHGGVVGDLPFLLGAFDQLFRAVRPGVGQDAVVGGLRGDGCCQHARDDSGKREGDRRHVTRSCGGAAGEGSVETDWPVTPPYPRFVALFVFL